MASTPGLNNAAGGGAGTGGNQVDRSVRHPKTSYNTKYYYNDKRVWECGHEMEYDSTKGAERIRMAHCDGSYFEYSKGGHKVESTKGHEFKYIQGGLTHTIDNNADLKYNGNVRTSIGKGLHAEINGKTSVAITKEAVLTFGKSASILSVDDLFIIAKNTTMQTAEHFNVDVGGDMGIKTKGNMNFRVKGSMTAKIDKNFKTQTGQNQEHTSMGDTIQTSKKKFDMSSQNDMKQTSKAKFTVEYQGDGLIDGQGNITVKNKGTHTRQAKQIQDNP